MDEYHKIDSVYKRDEKGKFLLGEWSRPEFEYLADLPWFWTEKIDGTNIRIMWDGKEITVGGKTNNAQIPNGLVNYLSALKLSKRFLDACLESAMCLYGEGYGAGIQSGGLYAPDQRFILFDVKIGDFWLDRINVVDIAHKLGLEVVPEYGVETLQQMIRFVQDQYFDWHMSSIGKAKVEGWVGTPIVPLFNRKGERIITKVKYKDFR